MKIKLKQNDTLYWDCEYKDDIGNPINISGYLISSVARSQRDKSKVLFEVKNTGDNPKITILNASKGLYRIMLETKGFPLGVYEVDIEYSQNGITRSTDTFRLEIVEGVTK